MSCMLQLGFIRNHMLPVAATMTMMIAAAHCKRALLQGLTVECLLTWRSYPGPLLSGFRASLLSAVCLQFCFARLSCLHTTLTFTKRRACTSCACLLRFLHSTSCTHLALHWQVMGDDFREVLRAGSVPDDVADALVAGGLIYFRCIFSTRTERCSFTGKSGSMAGSCFT